MANVLITACPHDAATNLGYFYLRKAADVLAQYGHKIIFLRTANLSNFRKALVKYDPKFVLLNGHGGSRSVTGCGTEILLGVCGYDEDLHQNIVRENPEWMTGRIVFLFTCNTGKFLAPRLFEEGALAVAAFNRDYIFLSEEKPPSRDMRAYPFFSAPTQLAILLAQGGTFREGVQAVHDAFLYYVDEAEAEGDETRAKFLNYDMENFVAYGNGRL